MGEFKYFFWIHTARVQLWVHVESYRLTLNQCTRLIGPVFFGVFFFPKGDFHFPWVICMYIEMRFFNLNGPGVSFSSKLITQQHTDLLKVYVCVSRKNLENNKMSKCI